MKILKRILIVIVIIIAIPLLIALFVKSEYAVERETIIKKPKQQVFDYVKMIKNQNNYSVWNMKDPNSKMNYTGTDGTVGFISPWESDMREVGKGEQEIKQITAGARVDMELRFKKPMEMTDNAYMITEAIDSTQTKVKWGFFGKTKYPLNIMGLFMDMDKLLGPDLQKGLDNLKGILEKQ
jgi:hypothetical protein